MAIRKEFKKAQRNVCSGVLTKLLHNEAGNTIALFAASIFPMIGLVGGAVDMGRLYSVSTKLQAACDSGALAARRVMGTSQFDKDDDGDPKNDAAYIAGINMFDFNFRSNYLGSENMQREFVEEGGTVSGKVQVDVPMLLMQVIGQKTRTLKIECESRMQIPHSDVMFVLDVTGSMNWDINNNTTTVDADRKITGLRNAAMCFYEALARQDIDAVDPEECGETANPVGDLSDDVQLRFGFVPFSSQVNVGNLIPNEYMKDQQILPSRRPTSLQTVFSYVLGNSSTVNNWDTAWTPNSNPGYSGWNNVNSSTNINGTNWPSRQTGATSATCNSYNTATGSILDQVSNTGGAGTQYLSPTPAAPVHPQATYVTDYKRDRNVNQTQYRYIWETRGGTTGCYLERRDRSYTETNSGLRLSQNITWTERRRIVGGWTYLDLNYDVSSLKEGEDANGNPEYAASIPMPIGEQTITGLRLSGQGATSGTISIPVVANVDATLNGCIEERQTFQNTDGDPSDEWTPIPGTALDMNLDSIPDEDEENTRWGYMFRNSVYTRSTGATDADDNYIFTQNNVVGTATSPWRDDFNGVCPTAARKMARYTGDAGAENFESYITGLTPNGGTYHDIGLIWGGRLMSPTGIFADENAETPGGQPINRHLIFMTDGVTDNSPYTYTPYGIEGQVRRRTDSASMPSRALLGGVTNEKTEAICERIKLLGDAGTTVWVIYYGNLAEGDPTRTRMEECATSKDKHFFLATSTAQITSQFKQIANAISELQLVS